VITSPVRATVSEALLAMETSGVGVKVMVGVKVFVGVFVFVGVKVKVGVKVGVKV